MSKQTILSGVQPTGNLHIGNYLGAVKQFVELQNKTDARNFYMIADLHSLTVSTDPQILRSNTLDLAATYIASGVDPNKSVIFPQSLVSAHAELAWIFSCITPLGELERMTQYKDKSGQQKSNVNLGLLSYPVLMASDILIYKPDLVPVGEDQMQHLELARIIARKFNRAFGETFPEPKNITLKPLRIMSLKDPAKKMSKTNDEPLMMDDTPEMIKKKLRKAVTATEGENSPGVDNLLFLLRQFGAEETAQTFQKQIDSGEIKYVELKDSLAEILANYFAEFRKKKQKLLSKPKNLEEILRDGATRAQKTADKTLAEVKLKIGLL